MAFEQALECVDVPLAVGTDLSDKQFYCVKVDANGQAVLATADTDRAFLLQNKPKGGTVEASAQLAIKGIVKGIAGGAINPGAAVAPTAANGKLQAAAAGDMSLGIHVGSAAAADGDVIPVLLTGHELL